MKKLFFLIFIFSALTGILYAGILDEESKSRGLLLCENLNMTFISSVKDQDSFLFTTYNVRCGKDESSKTFILRYDKILGTWSQHNLIK